MLTMATTPEKADSQEKQLCTVPEAELHARLQALDLTPIKRKLMAELGWAEEYAARMEIAYKRFLFLSVISPDPVVPSRDIDAFWHQHILDTRKYPVDCQRLFGFFLHHDQYFGMASEEEEKRLFWAFQRTADLYREKFGEDYASSASWCARNDCSQGVEAAYCGADHRAAAWCSAETQAAYCGADHRAAAWCAAETQAAYCGADRRASADGSNAATPA